MLDLGIRFVVYRGVRVNDDIDRPQLSQAISAKKFSQRSLNSIARNGVSQPFSHRQSDATVIELIWKSEQRDAAAAHTSTLVVNRAVLAARR